MASGFEYGRDMSVLGGALRSAELSLQEEDPALNLYCVCEEKSRSLALAVSRGIENAYRTNADSQTVHTRIHCALFTNLLLSSGIVDRCYLDFFESLLDSFPPIRWELFLNLVEIRSWRKQYIQCLQALPLCTRLLCLKAAHKNGEESPYIWSCTTSVLLWSRFVERHMQRVPSQDEALAALSRLPPSGNVMEHYDEVLLRTCMVQLHNWWPIQGVPSLTSVAALLHLVLDVITYSLHQTKGRLSHWDPQSQKTYPKSFYMRALPLTGPDLTNETLDVWTNPLLVSLVSLLGSKEVTRHFAVQQTGGLQGDVTCQEMEAQREELLRLCGDIVRLLRATPNLDRLPTAVRELKRISDVWAAEVPEEWEVDNAIAVLDGRQLDASEFIPWLLSKKLTEDMRVVQRLNKYVAFLSHPDIFPSLVQAAERGNCVNSFKELVLNVCDAAPLALQKAMLFYIFSERRQDLQLKLGTFSHQLTEKLNQVCDQDSSLNMFDGMASLCIQSPSEVLQCLVELAVNDGCTALVSKVLEFLEPVCRFRPNTPECEESLMDQILGDCFQRLVGGSLKHEGNFVALLKDLSLLGDLFDGDALFLCMVPYLELAGVRDPLPDELFPVQAFMAVRHNISTRYNIPALQMLVQVLDKACTELNGARKERLLPLLEVYLHEILDGNYDENNWITLKSALQHCSTLCRTAFCRLLKPRNDAMTFETFLEPALEKPLLLEDEAWTAECSKLSAGHPDLEHLLLPHFCLWFAGATTEEWELLLKRLEAMLFLGKAGFPPTLTVVKYLALCMTGCKKFYAGANWSHLFSCFAKTTKKCLRQDVEDLQLIVKELVYCASMVPLQCREQALLLVLDAVQLLPSPLKDQLTSKIRAAVSTQLKEFADVIRCLQEYLDCHLVS